jgi:hypothetical protein
MNKNVLIIGGGIAIIGVGAYLYFKSKAKTNAETLAASTPTPPAGSVFTTPEEVEAITLKISTAKDLTNKICELKKAYNITDDNLNNYMNFSSNNSNDYMNFSIGGVNLNPFKDGIKLNSISPLSNLLGGGLSIGPASPVTKIIDGLIKDSKNSKLQKENRGKAIKMASELIIELKELGYKEVDCKMVKIT